MKRVPVEYAILASFATAAVFLGWLAAFGSWRLYGISYAGGALMIGYLATGVAAFWLTLRRKTAGARLSVIFYGMQVLTFPMPSGAPFKFQSLPTLYYRLNGDPSAPVSVNVLAIVLVIVALVLLAHYRERDGGTAQVPPNASLERTREG
jgi:hypothetical protein